MSSHPPGYQPVYGQPVGMNQGTVSGQPIGQAPNYNNSNVNGFQGGYVPMSPFEPGYDDY